MIKIKLDMKQTCISLTIEINDDVTRYELQITSDVVGSKLEEIFTSRKLRIVLYFTIS